MLNRFKNKLVNIVGGITAPGGKDSDQPSSPTLPQDVSPFPYARPAFLQLSTDEVQVSADHVSRPILVPRNTNGLPWDVGYAEVINAGKTKVNEDQARAEVLVLPKRNRSASVAQIINGEMMYNEASEDNVEGHQVPYFAVFDGHAGTGASLMAVNILHLIIQDKLLEVQHLIEAQLTGVIPILNHQVSPPSPSTATPDTPPFSPPPQVTTSIALLASNDDMNISSNNSETSQKTDDDLENTPVSIINIDKTIEKESDSQIETGISQAEPGSSPVTQTTDNNDILPTDLKNVQTDENSDCHESCLETRRSDEDMNWDQCNSADAGLGGKNSLTDQQVETPGVGESPKYMRPVMNLGLDRFSIDNLIEGALEAAFFDMDGVIGRERRIYRIPGGCTAVATIFFNNKLYVANAGDSRAILSVNGEMIPMTFDFTPETDRQRIQMMAWHHPELLCNMFTSVQFAHRVLKKDIGKRVLHRDGWRKCWSYKTVTEEDVKIPLIFGEGKKARLLGTIGVSRGFGDHDLRVYESDVFVKPFMTCMPEVRNFDLGKQELTPDDVLIIATDGLWDVTTNEKAISIVKASLSQFSHDDPNRYVSAAQELVMHARGVLQQSGGWRMSDQHIASGDDITVFVIPLKPHQHHVENNSTLNSVNDNQN